MTTRRAFIAGSIAVAAAATASAATTTDGSPMYGLIGKMLVKPGQREPVMTMLLDGITDIPGCLSYVVAEDPTDPDGIWITEVWDSERSHDASLSLPKVREVIARARPLIAGFSDRRVTTPRGGSGLGERPRG